MDDAGSSRRGLKPTLTSEITQAVAGAWGVSVDGAASLAGSTGLNLLASMDARPVVVRVHRPHVTRQRVEALQIAREAAARAGVPSALGILTRGGERCITDGSCVIEVEPFVASEHSMDSLPRIRRAMPTLARLHDALREADAAVPDAAADVSFANYLPAHEVAARTATGVDRIRSLDSELQQIADAAERLAHDLAATASAFDALPVQWCHGDFWDNNVLFRHGEIVLVTDYGFMGRRPRIDDLALTLYFTLWELVAAGHGDPRSALGGLVAAYDASARAPLSDEERHLLPLAMARQPLWSVGVWAAELDDPRAVTDHLRGHEVALALGRDILDSLDRWRRVIL